MSDEKSVCTLFFGGKSREVFFLHTIGHVGAINLVPSAKKMAPDSFLVWEAQFSAILAQKEKVSRVFFSKHVSESFVSFPDKFT